MLERWLEAEIEVIPAVDVLGEGAVRLHQGAYDEVVERAGDPVELARAFAEAGARRIHLVDLDGARAAPAASSSGRRRSRIRRRGPRSARASSSRSTSETDRCVLPAGPRAPA